MDFKYYCTVKIISVLITKYVISERKHAIVDY